MDPDEWDRVVPVNLAGTFWMCQEAVRRMREGEGEGGSIVNVSSLNGFRARAQFPTHVHAIAESGVIGLTMTLASEVGQYGIRVNCVAPGIHMSPIALDAAGPGAAGRRYFQEAAAATPLRRVVNASEMAGPISFLLGTDSAYVTGQMLPSDGGRATNLMSEVWRPRRFHSWRQSFARSRARIGEVGSAGPHGRSWSSVHSTWAEKVRKDLGTLNQIHWPSVVDHKRRNSVNTSSMR